MTTLIGVKTNESKPGIAIVTDRKLIIEESRVVQKREIKKVKVIEYSNGYYAVLASAGSYNKVPALFNYIEGKKVKAKKEERTRDFGKYWKSITDDKNFKLPDPFCIYEDAIKLKEQYHLIKNEKISATLWEKQLVRYVEGGEPKNDFTKRIVNTIRMMLRIEEDPIIEALRNKYFLEVDLLNKMYNRKGEDMSDATELLLATNRVYSKKSKGHQLGLYHVTSTGIVNAVESSDGLEYLCLGSGAEEAVKYFENEEFRRLNISSLENVTIPIAIDLAYGAFEKASIDPYTGETTDLVIAEEDGVDDRGERMMAEVEKFMKEFRDETKAEYQEKIEKYDKQKRKRKR